MKYRLQPIELDNGVLPYPFFIDDKNLVGRQDFWRGRPYKIIGFCKQTKAGDIDLLMRAFREDPQQAVSMYPVFSTKGGEWYTASNPIASVRELE